MALHLTDSVYSQAKNKLLRELSPKKEHFALNRPQRAEKTNPHIIKMIAVAQDVETSRKGKA